MAHPGRGLEGRLGQALRQHAAAQRARPRSARCFRRSDCVDPRGRHRRDPRRGRSRAIRRRRGPRETRELALRDRPRRRAARSSATPTTSRAQLDRDRAADQPRLRPRVPPRPGARRRARSTRSRSRSSRPGRARARARRLLRAPRLPAASRRSSDASRRPTSSPTRSRSTTSRSACSPLPFASGEDGDACRCCWRSRARRCSWPADRARSSALEIYVYADRRRRPAARTSSCGRISADLAQSREKLMASGRALLRRAAPARRAPTACARSSATPTTGQMGLSVSRAERPGVRGRPALPAAARLPRGRGRLGRRVRAPAASRARAAVESVRGASRVRA